MPPPPPLLVQWPEAAAPMLVVWLPYVISFLFQALQIINFTWILHDGAFFSLSSSKNFHTYANLSLRFGHAFLTKFSKTSLSKTS